MSDVILRQAGLARSIAVCFLPFAAGYFLSYLYRTVNAIIGPNLVADLGLDAASLGLLTSAYFVAFAAFQLPLGILLDRFGPRRVEAILLLSAALGAVLFGLAQNVVQLTIGRALIGLGVSSCLMAGFKANAQYWPTSRLALSNGFLMAFGGLGATVATLPVEWFLRVSDWRMLFVVLAATTVAVAVLIWVTVPERVQGAPGRLDEQVRAVKAILQSDTFWRVAPMTVMAQVSFLAYQGLWAGPWLRDVAGFGRETTATILFLMALAMIPGFALGGYAADRLLRAGIRHHTLLATFVALFLAVQVPLAFNVVTASGVLWVAFGLLGTGSVLGFSYLTRQYPAEYAGRVNTALNVMIFVCAFAAQAGIGVIIGLFSGEGDPFSASGHQAAFVVILVLQALGWLWFVLRRRPEDP